MRRIYISPSSQTQNDYAAGNTTEGIQCREIGRLLQKALARCGFNALTNSTADMYARVKESNTFGADLHLCIHTNAHNGKVAGTRIFCNKLGGPGYKAAEAIMKRLAPITPGTSDNIDARPELYEVRAVKAPTVYVEVDFHDVPSVASWIVTHKEEIAEAITRGLCDYYGVTYKGSDAPAPAPSGKMLRVQVWAGYNREYAKEQLAKAKAAGFPDAFIAEG